MKKFILWAVSIILIFSMAINTFAMPFNPDDYTSVDEVSEFLPKGVKQDRVIERATRRGDFFISAELLISNQGNGKIGALAIGLMEVNVEEAYITVYLDRWDEIDRRWKQIRYYDAEFYAKDYPDGLNTPTVDITFTDLPIGDYYRLRSAFAAYKDGQVEGFSPSTGGILLD